MNPQEKINVLLFLRRVGPYHHARFENAAGVMDLAVAETRPASQEYPWQFEAVGRYRLEKFSLNDSPETGIRGPLLHETVSEVVQECKPDVIVTTGWADPEYHAVVLYASRQGIPLVVISDSRHEDEPRKFYKEFIKRIVLRSYSSALVAGKTSREYLIRLGFNNASIFQPWDVVDNQYFAQRSSLQSIGFADRFFLCVSRFIPKKNLLRLVEAFAQYRKSGGKRKLVLLGSGELEESIRAKISELNLDDVIDLEGFIQYDSLPEYFSRALCLILPSLSDQWGLVVNEAMASGLPVLVSSHCGCAADLVREKVNGCTFDPLQVEAISNALLFMDNQDESAWREMGESSRQIIADWDLKDFSQGLLNACLDARRPGNRGLRIVHALLSKT